MYFPLVVIIIFWQKVCIYASIFVCLKIVVSLWFIFPRYNCCMLNTSNFKIVSRHSSHNYVSHSSGIAVLYLKASKYDWLLLGLSARFQHLFVLWQHLLFCAAWMPTSSIYATSPQVEGVTLSVYVAKTIDVLKSLREILIIVFMEENYVWLRIILYASM